MRYFFLNIALLGFHVHALLGNSSIHGLWSDTNLTHLCFTTSHCSYYFQGKMLLRIIKIFIIICCCHYHHTHIHHHWLNLLLVSNHPHHLIIIVVSFIITITADNNFFCNAVCVKMFYKFLVDTVLNLMLCKQFYIPMICSVIHLKEKTVSK